METIEIEITKEDVDKSSGFLSNTNCPLANATKRALNKNSIFVGTSKIYEDFENCIGTISPCFNESAYNQLIKTGEPFKTTLTLWKQKN